MGLAHLRYGICIAFASGLPMRRPIAAINHFCGETNKGIEDIEHTKILKLKKPQFQTEDLN